mmetsp:Transcript_10548/g.20288  ORF Transcript_10548/g.20288 Transcript_10548/m.20288 type:complete len:764 (-) Transcript_10548:2891-5182(-)
MSLPNVEEIDQFLEEVDSVYEQVQAIASGKLDVPIKEPKKRVKAEEVKITSRPGKGQKFDTYMHYCSSCCIEFLEATPECPTCHKATMTSEERRADLMQKVAQLQKERALKAQKKVRWENWKKTQAMLHKKTSTNYNKWHFFEDDEEEPIEEEFVPPANDPTFEALERDMKERGERRKADKLNAEKLKDKGNGFYREGKYRNALKAYEEAIQFKKDWLILYTNAALARIKLEDYEGAIKDCQKVMDYCEVFEDGYEKSPDVCFKALSRKAMAHRGLHQYAEAVSALQTALTLNEDAEAKQLLERSKADAALLPRVESREWEILDADLVIQELQTEEKVIDFNATGGGSAVIKAILESKDENALRILEFLAGTEARWYYLGILAQPVYDKRRIGAVVLLQAIEKYIEDISFISRVLEVLALAIENMEFRQQIVKHSAFTKGKKFVKYFYELYFRLPRDPSITKTSVLLMSNLCLTAYNTPLNRIPNPGNMKSCILHSWPQFIEEAARLGASDAKNELLGLLCNMATESNLQELLLKQQELISLSIETLKTSLNSLALERTLGLLTNCFSSADHTELALPYASEAYAGCSRMLSLSKSTPEITRRSLLLLVKLLTRSPSLTQQLKADTTARTTITKGLDAEATVDSSIKILALAASDPEFSQLVDLPRVLSLASFTLETFYKSGKLEERAANLASLISRLAETLPLTHFTSLIELMINIIRDKTGPARKNCGIAVAKIAKCDVNIEELRRVHGIEVLASVAQFLI